MSLKTLAIIPARYASTRFPGKPLIPILGKSLLQRTYENAVRAGCIDEIVIATDDTRIFDHVAAFGGKAVMTSVDCVNGTERIADLLRKYPDYMKASVIINIQGDEPCLDVTAIESVVRLLAEDPDAVMATVAAPLTCEDDAFNPGVVKCVMDKKSNALYFSRGLIPGSKEKTYSGSAAYYRHIGLYAYRPEFILTYQGLSPTPLQTAEDLEQLKVLEHGYRIKVGVVDHVSPGVDTPEDIQKVEQYLCKQNTSLLRAESVLL